MADLWLIYNSSMRVYARYISMIDDGYKLINGVPWCLVKLQVAQLPRVPNFSSNGTSASPMELPRGKIIASSVDFPDDFLQGSFVLIVMWM